MCKVLWRLHRSKLYYYCYYYCCCCCCCRPCLLDTYYIPGTDSNTSIHDHLSFMWPSHGICSNYSHLHTRALRLREVDQLARHEGQSWNLKAYSFNIRACAINHYIPQPPYLQGQGCVLVRCYRRHADTQAPSRQDSGGPGSRDGELSEVWPEWETALLPRGVKVALQVGSMWTSAMGHSEKGPT